MGYSIGYADGRDIGYGVVATCDQPGCDEKIDRGMSYCCGEFRNDNACGLYFCGKHLFFGEETQLCDNCLFNEELGEDAPYEKYKAPHEKKTDHPDWVWWKLNHSSWDAWRSNNPDEVKQMKQRLKEESYEPSEGLKEWLSHE